MPGGSAEFFREIGRADAAAIERLAFDVAYFWRMTPDAVMELGITRLFLYARHAGRIVDEMGKKD